MYSRYSGISIPSNYGGNRFKLDPEPEVKAHRPSTLSASKVAHSPSFHPTESVVSQHDESNIFFENSEEATQDVYENAELDSNTDSFEMSNEGDLDMLSSSSSNKVDKEQGLSKIRAILSRFDKDSLIILGLILLLMSDSDKENDDIIALLALLLLG